MRLATSASASSTAASPARTRATYSNGCPHSSPTSVPSGSACSSARTTTGRARTSSSASRTSTTRPTASAGACRGCWRGRSATSAATASPPRRRAIRQPGRRAPCPRRPTRTPTNRATGRGAPSCTKRSSPAGGRRTPRDGVAAGRVAGEAQPPHGHRARLGAGRLWILARQRRPLDGLSRAVSRRCVGMAPARHRALPARRPRRRAAGDRPFDRAPLRSVGLVHSLRDPLRRQAGRPRGRCARSTTAARSTTTARG